MKVDDTKVLPLDDQAILSGEPEELLIYMRKLVKKLNSNYAHLSNGINVNEGRGFNDLLFSGESLARPAAGSPTLTTFRGNVMLYAFDGSSGVDAAFFTAHVLHDYIPGTKIFPHIHWSHIIGSPSGDVVWQVEYTVAKGHTIQAFPATTTIELQQTAGAQFVHHLIETSDADAIVSTDLEPDSVITGRIFRDAGHSNDTFANDAYLLHIDFHYESDTIMTNEKVRPAKGWTKN